MASIVSKLWRGDEPVKVEIEEIDGWYCYHIFGPTVKVGERCAYLGLTFPRETWGTMLERKVNHDTGFSSAYCLVSIQPVRNGMFDTVPPVG